MLDPVAKTRLELPSILTRDDHDGSLFRLSYNIDAPPAILTVVEDDDCTFQVFLISSRALGAPTGFFLYESKTNAWRDLGNPVQEVGRRSQTVSTGEILLIKTELCLIITLTSWYFIRIPNWMI